MKLADKLKQLRKQKNISQEAVANFIGVTRRTYISYECDGRYPRKREIYRKLAECFGVDVNYLLADDEEFIQKATEQYGSKGRAQAQALVAELAGLFAGGELTDSDRDAVMIALQKAYFDCKEDNKKYTPNKYKK